MKRKRQRKRSPAVFPIGACSYQDLQDSLRYWENWIRGHGIFLVATQQQRNVIGALYGSSRALDYIVDELPSSQKQRKLLQETEELVYKCLDQDPTIFDMPAFKKIKSRHPWVPALYYSLSIFPIQRQQVLSHIHVQKNLKKYHCPANRQVMKEYMYHAGGLPTLTMFDILELDSRRKRHKQKKLESLCHYFQYANVTRDFFKDAMKGWVFLPASLFGRKRMRAQDILRASPEQFFPGLREFALEGLDGLAQLEDLIKDFSPLSKAFFKLLLAKERESLKLVYKNPAAFNPLMPFRLSLRALFRIYRACWWDNIRARIWLFFHS